MAMTYTSLTATKTNTGSIAAWTNYSKLDIEGALEDAQSLIFQTLRVREMQTGETVNISLAAETATLPTGYISPMAMRDISNDSVLRHMEWSELEDIRDYSTGVVSTGKPCAFSVYGEQLQFDTKADTAIIARLMFYKKPDNLSADNETNFLTTRYPHLLRSAIMASAYSQLRNTEAQSIEMSKFSAYLVAANTQDDLDTHRGQSL